MSLVRARSYRVCCLLNFCGISLATVGGSQWRVKEEEGHHLHSQPLRKFLAIAWREGQEDGWGKPGSSVIQVRDDPWDVGEGMDNGGGQEWSMFEAELTRLPDRLD